MTFPRLLRVIAPLSLFQIFTYFFTSFSLTMITVSYSHTVKVALCFRSSFCVNGF